MVEKKENRIKTFDEVVEKIESENKNEVKMDSKPDYLDDYVHFKQLGIELIDKSIEFLMQAKRMLFK